MHSFGIFCLYARLLKTWNSNYKVDIRIGQVCSCPFGVKFEMIFFIMLEYLEPRLQSRYKIWSDCLCWAIRLPLLRAMLSTVY